MVGRKRVYRPYSSEKIKQTVYAIAAARMGVLGSDNPLLQYTVLNYATSVAERWNEVASWASQLYHQLVSKYNVEGLKRAAVRALVGVAAKYMQAIKRGISVSAESVRNDLTRAVNDMGVDVPAGVIDDIVSAVVTEVAA